MKKMIAAVLLVCLLALTLSAGAEIYVGQERPDDWASRDLLRLMVFKFHANDAMLLECGGETMLIDGGIRNYYPQLGQALADLGKTELTWMFNSHPHDDHIGCQQKLLEHDLATTGGFISPFREDYRVDVQAKMVRTLREKGVPYHQMMEGETMQLGGAELTLMQCVEARDANALSGVLHVRFGQSTMMLTGDLSGASANWFLEHYSPELLNADILKYPHHALVNMPAKFLDAVDPGFVFITNSKRNTVEEVKPLTKRGIPFLWNESGRITLETDGTDWYIWQDKGLI